MKAYIILVWKNKKVEYPKLIGRKEFVNYLKNISENSELLKKVKALSKEVDTITVNEDEDLVKNEKNLIFSYKENVDFNETEETVEIGKDTNIYYFIKSYCQERIIFNIIENGKERIGSKPKNQIISIMQAIRNAYPDNNEVSTKLCEILTDTYSIVINKDRNNSCPENPIIICYTVKEERYKVITVMNNHKIIWAHLNEWCK